MTLIEVLVVITVIGLIAAVISAAISVVIRQAPETVARVDAARWEQNLGTWLPADLTSAEWPVDTDGDGTPDDPTEAVDYAPYEPCASADCTFGDNIAHFSWSENGADVDVSYRYGQADPPDGPWEFRRVECRAGSCFSITLVHDMPPPSSGGDPPITVTFPPPVTSTTPSGPVEDTGGRRVQVSVYGPNGIDLLSFAGGGIDRVDLEPAAIQPPQFLQARSACGGPISLIVDESGSIGGAVTDVRLGVKSFVETFAGTPTQLQIIGFNREARALGSGGAWNHWYDLSEQSTVDLLLGGSSPIDGLGATSWTNWEDALYRAFYTETGQTYQAIANPALPPSELVVFFTDGMPTYERTEDRTGPATPSIPTAEIPDHFDHGDNGAGGGSTRFDPRAWYRAWWLLQENATRVIGVGVGPAFSGSTNLDLDTNIPDAEIAADWSAPYDPTSGESHPRAIPAEVTLGDLVAGNDLSNYDGDASERFVKVEYDGGWDAEAVKNADILTTNDFTKFGGALESIALAECGGTLTVQTRKASDGQPLASMVTYEVTGDDRPLTESSTSAVNKTAVFDIAADGAASADVLLKPRSLEGTGYVADDWVCRSGNVEINDPARVAPAGPAAIDGLDLTVQANEAMSCILLVVPE